MKFCKLCAQSKPTSEFGSDKRNKSGIRYCCKLCRKKEYKSKEKSEYNKKWYLENRDRQIENAKDYAENNKIKIRIYKNNYDKKKSAYSTEYRIKRSLRARLRSAIRHGLKSGSAVRDLGCTVEFFKNYIESKFKDGMSWENYGNKKYQWQIDHIRCLASFDLNDRQQLKEAVNYTNLQPLWYNEHVAKTRMDRKTMKR